MPRREFITILELTPNQIGSFWNKVEKKGPDECWEWTGFRNKKGYGCFNAWNSSRKKYQMRMTHRIAFAVSNNAEPPELVCHSCDNPTCCNPNHLFAGDDKLNAIDRELKGRRDAPRGSKAGLAKLNETQVVEIKNKLKNYKLGDFTRLAKEYGVTAGVIQSIRYGRTWTHVH